MSKPRTIVVIKYGILTVVFFSAITFPYLIAARAGGDNFVFGGFLLNPLDGNSYLSKMIQGWQGQWKFELTYTPERGQGAYLFLFYLFLGQLARWLNLPLLVVFHAARVAASGFLLIALYRFWKRVLPEEKNRQRSLLFAIFGSGLGWIAVVFGAFTADLWVAEAYPFLSAFANPHFPLGLGLLLWLLSISNEENRNISIPEGVGLSSAAFLLGIVSPFGVVVALSVTSLVAGWTWLEKRKSWRRLAVRTILILVGGGGWLLYDLWVASSDPLFAGWNAQNLTPSPPPWDLLLSFSPVLILAVFGVRKIFRSDHWPMRMLLVWVALSLLILYLPLGLQRRFVMGLYVPIVGLAVMGLDAIEAHRPRLGWVLLAAAFIFSLPTNSLILLSGLHGAQTHDPGIYLSREEANALSWISEHTPKDAVILAAPETGLLIPAHTGRRVIYGHPYETVQAEQRQNEALEFYRMTDEDLMEDYLREGLADFVFYGPRERQLGTIRSSSLLDFVYAEDGVEIYRVAR